MKSRVLMYHIAKIVAVIAFIGLIIALPVTAIPFSYTVITNEEIDWNHFKTVITMPAQPSVIGVKNAIDAGKSNNIIIAYWLTYFLSFFGVAQFVWTAVRRQKYDIYGNPVDE